MTPRPRRLHTARLWAVAIVLRLVCTDRIISSAQGLVTEAAAAAEATLGAVSAAAALDSGSSNGTSRRLLAGQPPPAFRFHRLYTDGASLSAADVVVLGFGAPYAAVTATLALRGRVVASGSSRANYKGRWAVPLGRPRAGTGYTVTAATQLTGRKRTISIKDVQVGQLWLLAGQSNIIMSLRDIITRGTAPWQALAAAEARRPAPSIRTYRVPWANFSTAAPDLAAHGRVSTGIFTTTTGTGRWEALRGGTLQTSGALGVLLAKELQRRLPGTPIGIIQAAVGSTSIQRWLPPVTLRAVLPPDGRTPAADPRFSLFNGMVAPLRNVALDGVVWYQGESDTSVRGPLTTTSHYQALLRGLIGSWRQALAQPRLPFHVIQLPGYRPGAGNTFAVVREAQRQAVLHTSGAHLVATFDTDTNNGRTLHPDSKLVVAQRLADSILAARGVRGAPAMGPVLLKAAFSPKGGASLRFAFHGGGLRLGRRAGARYRVVTGRAPIRCFELKGADGRWRGTTGSIVGVDTVRLAAAAGGDGRAATGVRYAWSDLPVGCNLYSRLLLPTVPFVQG